MTKRPIIRRRLSGFLRYFCLSGHRGNRTNDRFGRGFIKGGLTLVVQSLCTFNLALLSASFASCAEESATPPPTSIDRLEQTNSQELLEAMLQLQGQLRANQLAIEQNEREAKEATAHNAEALSNGFGKIENAFSAQQEDFSARSTRELEAMKSSNRALLIVACTFAAIALLAMVVTGYFQWRMSNVWADLSSVFPMARSLARGSTVAALGGDGQPLVPLGPVENSNLRLLAAIEQLDKRIQDLEHISKPAVKGPDPVLLSGDDHDQAAASKPGTTRDADQTATTGDARISELLQQGHARLKENDLEAGLRCFDEVLVLNPNHSEALVRKGATLERMKKHDEAFECYDRAIAADDSMTIAYLYKGGLCNQLDRFKEALECYEKALKTQDRWGA